MASSTSPFWVLPKDGLVHLSNLGLLADHFVQRMGSPPIHPLLTAHGASHLALAGGKWSAAGCPRLSGAKAEGRTSICAVVALLLGSPLKNGVFGCALSSGTQRVVDSLLVSLRPLLNLFYLFCFSCGFTGNRFH